MHRSAALAGCAILVASAAGCTGSPVGNNASVSTAQEDVTIRETFQAFQAAVKARDAEKTWSLLDKESRAAAEEAAKSIRERHAQTADGPGRAALARKLGLEPPDVAKLDGKAFLRTSLFHEKYEELPDGKISKPPSVQGEKATVYYDEPDGDKESLTLVKEDGKWKVSAPMPKLPKP